MVFERITGPEHPLYEDAIHLYKISFPPYEQREEMSQTDILRNPAYHFDVVCDGGTFCVLPAMRNKRYGQKILAALQERPLILEIDPPVNEVSRRRKVFYQRCGFVENPYSHIHPPYHKGHEGHGLVVMSSPNALTPEEYETFQRALRDTVMLNAW